MAQEVAADQLGDEFKGYVVRITGGNDVRVACSLTLGVCIAQVTDAIYSPTSPSLTRLDSTRLPCSPASTQPADQQLSTGELDLAGCMETGRYRVRTTCGGKNAARGGGVGRV